MSAHDLGELRYRLRFVHFWLFNCIHQFHSPAAQAFNVLCALGVGAIGWMADEDLGTFAWSAALGYGAIWVLQWLFNAVYLCRRHNRVLTEHVVQIRPEGLVDSTQTYETLNRWPGVLRVRSYPGLVAVYIGPFEAVIVPKTAFASPEARARWVALVQQQLRAAA